MTNVVQTIEYQALNEIILKKQKSYIRSLIFTHLHTLILVLERFCAQRNFDKFSSQK